MNSETKTCQNCKQNFTIEPEDFSFYEKIKVPAPTFCPECRTQRRMAFRNERFVYKKKSDYSGKEIFCGYPPESPVKVYENNIWNSDEWDSMSFSKEIDFSKPFLSQILELIREVPRPAMSVIDMVNSDYCNNASGGKNCYLLFNFAYAENCFYGSQGSYIKDSADILSVNKSELVYDSFGLNNCSRAFFSNNCEDCANIYFSKNLKNCSDCFGCVNLRNKSHFIFNKPYSKDEYDNKLKQYQLNSHLFVEEIKNKAHKFWLEFPNKYFEGRQIYNSTGNYIYNSKNALNAYIVRDCEDVKYCQYLYISNAKDAYDHTLWGEGSSLTYECLQVGNKINNVKFCAHCWPDLKNSQYAMFCSGSSDLFGCIGLKKKQYCILNKQYTKEEYEELLPKIIQHMNDMPYIDKKGISYKYGEFFPIDFSPSPYNETIAQEHFFLGKSQIESNGYSWKEPFERNIVITISNDKLPDKTQDVSDSITNEIIECAHKSKCNENCTGAFKIIKPELEFYRKMNLPLPRLCPNCRHYQRIKQRNPLKLWHRKCQCNGNKSDNGIYQNTATHQHGERHCENTFETTYSPDRKEIVYCEHCYQQEVV